MSGGLACGFGDVTSGLAGFAWDLGEPAAALLEGEDEAHLGSFGLEQGGDAATLEIAAGEATVEGVLAPEIEPILLEPAEGAGGALTVTLCAAEIRRKEGGETIECRGQISRWSADPLRGVGTFRQLAIEGPDGALFVAVAAGGPGADGHGEESSSAWRIDSDGRQSPFEEALISTQYSGSGRPTRVGLELWPGEEAPPTRIAGSVLGSAEFGSGWAVFLHARSDGAEGIGTYLLWRA